MWDLQVFKWSVKKGEKTFKYVVFWVLFHHSESVFSSQFKCVVFSRGKIEFSASALGRILKASAQTN